MGFEPIPLPHLSETPGGLGRNTGSVPPIHQVLRWKVCYYAKGSYHDHGRYPVPIASVNGTPPRLDLTLAQVFMRILQALPLLPKATA
jgi:hypothetical protein